MTHYCTTGVDPDSLLVLHRLPPRSLEGRREQVQTRNIDCGAKTAFLDENARVIPDPEHSEDENRFVLLGLSISVQVLVVCHCYRQDGEVIRIISARKADSDEIEQYHWWQR